MSVVTPRHAPSCPSPWHHQHIIPGKKQQVHYSIFTHVAVTTSTAFVYETARVAKAYGNRSARVRVISCIQISRTRLISKCEINEFVAETEIGRRQH